MSRDPARSLWLPAGGYLLLFAILFAPLAREGRLPGNCDTWLNGLALPNAMLARASSWFTGTDPGTSLYPQESIFQFGESAFGTSALFIAFRLVAGEDALAYYLFTVTLLALNGLGVYLLARLYVSDNAAAAFAGLAFAACGFTLGNLDSPHTSFFFVAFLSLRRLGLHLRTGERRHLMAAAALCGLQAWFSAYIFLFTAATGAALLAIHLLLHRRSLPGRLPGLAAAGAVLLALGAPFFAWHAVAQAGPGFVNPWDPVFLAEIHSLEPEDLVRPLEGNVLYPFHRPVTSADIGRTTHAMIEAGVLRMEDLTTEDARLVMGTLSTPEDVKLFVTTRRCAFAGLVLYALAILGVVRTRRWELPALYAVSFLVALGPFVTVAGRLLPNVTWPLYRWLEPAGLLRVPSRAFSFAVLALCLAAAAGLEGLTSAASRRHAAVAALLPAAFCLAVFIENVPFPPRSFAGSELATPGLLAGEFFRGKRGRVVLNLPSRPGGALFRDSGDLFEWNREAIYMNRQTYLRQNVLNGVHGYFPRSRLEVQRLIEDLPAPGALAGLRRMGVDYFIYHHDLELPWERGLYDRLASSAELEIVATSPAATILGWAGSGAATRRERGAVREAPAGADHGSPPPGQPPGGSRGG